jgi:molecular chaperone GrpE
MFDTPPRGARGGPPDDDIEILEVVGVDETSEPPEDPADEIELIFEDEPAASGKPSLARAVEAPAGADAVHRERYQRLAADFDNLKKRMDREREDFERLATRDLVSRLLVVLDNFERALAAGREASVDAAFRQGVTLIHRQLYDELCKEGLTAVDAVGEAFDPAIHEAVATDPGSALPPNTVVEELQRGYYFRGQLLRPALVRVATASGQDEPRGAGKGV